MTNKGKLFLIPSSIAEGNSLRILTPQLKEVLPEIHEFLAENVRSARRFLAGLRIYESIEPLAFSVLDKDTEPQALGDLMSPLFTGRNLGVLSEAGCPGVADPGARAVLFAHQNDIRVVPLVGPSSILLALMGSGLNGQNFAFHGYLPVEKDRAANSIKELERESRQKNQTKIFIETPYRNQSLFDALLKNLSPDTLLTIAMDLTGPSEFIQTKPVKIWSEKPQHFEKIPTVFLFLG